MLFDSEIIRLRATFNHTHLLFYEKQLPPPLKYKKWHRPGIWLLILLGMGCGLLSCVGEETPVDSPIEENEADQAVADARAWFGPQEEFQILPKNSLNSKGTVQTKKVQWEEYIIHRDGSVVEVNLEYNYHPVPLSGEKTMQELTEKAEKAFHRLIIEKDGEREYVKYLLKYFPKSETDARQALLESNNFLKVDEGYTGEIQLLSWEEELLKGWTMEQGQITRFYIPRPAYKNPVSAAQTAQE